VVESGERGIILHPLFSIKLVVFDRKRERERERERERREKKKEKAVRSRPLFIQWHTNFFESLCEES